jgi:hypothetical protein
MEHPAEMHMKECNSAILLSFFQLVFDQLPTYDEIVNGTPKLSLLYKAAKEDNTTSSLKHITGLTETKKQCRK